MEMLEMNITCSLLFLLAEFLEVLQGCSREPFKLEMKNKMMGFSFEKMGIENRIKRSRNPWLLNFDFGDFLNLR